ncbi:MAG: TatD family hydrolase [Candidatus Pacebacteria bacterium]|nr:TatD family hydrolase [Candidatus Paceibacterota bacterium]
MEKFIDTHAHLNFDDFKKDRFEIIEECLLNQISMINVGTVFFDSKAAVEIAEKYDRGVYASIGLHPLYVEEEDFNIDEFKELAKSKKVIAIGETGLDYFYNPKTLSKEEYIKKQKDVFLKQIDLAEESNLPLIIHSRNAFDDLYEILKDKRVKGVIHCFTGDLKDLERFLNLGFYIGFNGIIFKTNLDEVIKNTPADRILFETDSPFLTPSEFYTKRNNPMSLKIISEKISKIKGEDILSKAYENSLKLFNI